MKRALPILIAAARSGRDQQSARLARARQALAHAGTTMARLQEFRAGYLARSAASTLRGSDAAALQDYQHFIDRLDEAIALQAREMRGREADAAQEELALLQRQKRLLAFEALLQRQVDAAAAQAHRREQREADEFAASAGARRAREAMI